MRFVVLAFSQFQLQCYGMDCRAVVLGAPMDNEELDGILAHLSTYDGP